MHISRVSVGNRAVPAMFDPDRGYLLADDVLDDVPGDVPALLQAGRLAPWQQASWSAPHGSWRDPVDVRVLAPIRGAEKILGIGLNYVDHAGDLDETVPTEPATFPKWPHTVLDPGEPIPVPADSDRVTAEGELAVVIGSAARDVPVDEALDHVLGFVAVLDQTAEDVLRRNPRFLTRSKNYPGFLACGTAIVPTTDVLGTVGTLADLRVTTMLNGRSGPSNVGRAMTFGVPELVSFQSGLMPLLPGDVILTGTPGAVVIVPGDEVTADVQGVGRLTHRVVADGRSRVAAG